MQWEGYMCAILRELSSFKNVTIGSHGKSHLKLTSLSISNLKNELEYSKKYLEDLTGTYINSISYPHGSYNNNVIKEVEACKYDKGACSIFGSIRDSTNKFLIPRIDIWSNDTIKTVEQKIITFTIICSNLDNFINFFFINKWLKDIFNF